MKNCKLSLKEWEQLDSCFPNATYDIKYDAKELQKILDADPAPVSLFRHQKIGDQEPA